jgi:dienelactone hydrolase
MKLFITFLLLSALQTHIHGGSSVITDVSGQPYEGYYTAPAEGRPLVLILHDWDGLTDYEIARADMLHKHGYAVMAADLFGKGIRPTKVEDKRQHTGELYRNRDKLRSLILAAIEEAGRQGADTSRTVVMGYCFGGAAALEIARAGADLKGIATFHGGLGTPEGQDYSQTDMPILVFHGSADTLITLTDLATLGTELEEAGVPHELISYGGAPHSFTVFNAPAYRADADAASWNRFLNFLHSEIPLEKE